MTKNFLRKKYIKFFISFTTRGCYFWGYVWFCGENDFKTGSEAGSSIIYVNTLIFLWFIHSFTDERLSLSSLCNLFTINHFEWRTHPYSSILILNLNDGAASKIGQSEQYHFDRFLVEIDKFALIDWKIKYVFMTACTVYNSNWGSIKKGC